MATSLIEAVLERYASRLNALEDAPSEEKVFAVLLARDDVEAVLFGREENSGKTLVNIIRLNQTSQGELNTEVEASLHILTQLDVRLQQQENVISEFGKLEKWRKTLKPSTEAWWWFPETPTSYSSYWTRFEWLSSPQWRRLDGVWSFISIIALAASVSLAIDISSRFLEGGPELQGTIAVIFSSFLALLAGSTTLPKVGRRTVEKVLSKARFPKYIWQEISALISIAVFLLLLTFHNSLPLIANWFSYDGLKNYEAHQLAVAELRYKRVLRLNPNHTEANFSLGLIYEDLNNIESAKEQYQIAVKGRFIIANNNLARLYILENEPTAAFPLLREALDTLGEIKNPEYQSDYLLKRKIEGWLRANQLTLDEFEYALLKNLGWAQLQDRRFVEAETNLKDATAIIPEEGGGAAHCLLALVEEGETGEENPEAWENCLAYATESDPDEYSWLKIARQRRAESNTFNEAMRKD